MPSKFDPQKHHHRSIRLANYDYSQPGAYYITIVTYQRVLLFGKIVNAEMQLNHFGRIADECWHEIPTHFPNVELGVYVVMPNHVHGIIVILPNNFKNPLLVKSLPSSAHLSPRLRAASGVNSIKQASGNEIITNISSVTIVIFKTKRIT